MNTFFQVLSLAWSIQGGALPTLAYPDGFQHYASQTAGFTEYGVEFDVPAFTWTKSDLDGFYVGGSIQNVFTTTSQALFEPIQDVYRVDVGLRWKELEVGYEHVCSHSVESYEGQLLSQYLFGGYDKVFVRLSGRI